MIRTDRAEGWRYLLLALTGAAMVVYLVNAFLWPAGSAAAGVNIQDDARQFLAWMPRLANPELLRGDLLADYWHSVSPWLYRLIYAAPAAAGVAPALTAKLLPLPLLALSAWASWRVASVLTGGRPVAAFVAAAFLIGFLLHEDSLWSATPRAFSAPLFLLFLDGLLRGRKAPVLIALVLLAALYPTTALIGLSMLGLSRLRLAPRPGIDLTPGWAAVIAAAAAAIPLAALPLRGQTGVWGPVLELAEAMTMPNLATYGGRSSLVAADGTIGWVCSGRMGFLPEMMPCGWGLPGAELVNLLLFLPLLFLALSAWRPGREANRVYFWALIAGLFWYGAALCFAFDLHLPSRYSQRVAGLLLWLAIGQLVGAWVDGRLRDGRLDGPARIGVGATFLLLALSFATPTPGLQRPADPGLVARIAALPPAARIAGIADDLDFVPALAGRPVLATVEHAIPYHLGYFRPVADRMRPSLVAVSTPDPAQLRHILAAYRIDALAIDRSVLRERRVPDSYRSVLPQAAAEADRALAAGGPAFLAAAHRCALYDSPQSLLLDARCLAGIEEMRRAAIAPS